MTDCDDMIFRRFNRTPVILLDDKNDLAVPECGTVRAAEQA